MPKRPPKGKTEDERAINDALRSQSTALRAARKVPYHVDLCATIVDRLAEGETMTSICDHDKMPNRVTVYRWIREYPEFADAVAKAREVARSYFEDTALDLARSRDEFLQDRKNEIETMFELLDRNEEALRKLNQPKDPKLIDATQDVGGGWRVSETGERINPIAEAIENFERKKGYAESGS